MEKLDVSGRSHVRWVVLLLLCLMYLITYLDRVSLANTAPFIMKEYGFSKATMGVIFSAFIWAYALFQVPGGWLGDRFGPRQRPVHHHGVSHRNRRPHNDGYRLLFLVGHSLRARRG